MVTNSKFIKKNYKVDKPFILQYEKSCENVFKSMSDSYFDFLRYYFYTNERGELDGFRFVRRFS